MPEQNYVEDEIDLRDYIKVILKRKKVIFAIFFVAVITAIIVSFLMPCVYEATSIIQLGSIDELLINKQEAKEILLSCIFLEPIIKELNLFVSLKQLNTKIKQLKKCLKIEDIKDTNLLRIKVEYPDPDIVVKLNEAIANSFISQSKSIYQQRVFLIAERLKELEKEIKETQDEVRRTQDLITQLPTSSDISQQELSLRIILLQNTLSNYEAHLTNLMNQRNNLKMQLIRAKDFKVIDFSLKPDFPIKPKKKLNVAIATVLGLILGVFTAFFQEFWQKAKR